MNNDSTKYIREQLAIAQGLVGALERQLDETLERQIPYPAGSRYIALTVRHPNSVKRHEFAAIKVTIAGQERWFTTGATCPPKGRTWQEMQVWLSEADEVTITPLMIDSPF